MAMTSLIQQQLTMLNWLFQQHSTRAQILIAEGSEILKSLLVTNSTKSGPNINDWLQKVEIFTYTDVS